MCGITGYIGARPAVETALNNLKRLEYRGYDSAGIAYPSLRQIRVVRAAGKIANLERALLDRPHEAHIAIAHTRWATHGRPCEANAHPHRDCTGRLALVHNGIIENYAELRQELRAHGHEFLSETDTEVLAHLIEAELDKGYAPGGSFTAEEVAVAVRAALKRVIGSYAVAVICQDTPETVFVARKDSPLVIGLGQGENFLASDIPAVMRYTRRVVLLEDGDFAAITTEGVAVTDLEGNSLARAVQEITWDDTAAEKGGYPHFMLKEIYEGPRTVCDTLRGRLTETGHVVFPGLPLTAADWARFKRLAIVACGTAYHAGVVGKRLFEQLLRRPVEVSVASEFRYSDPLVDPETLVILISQSGETADTLAAMREAKRKGATTLAIVNVVGSTLAREADAVLLTQAGPEIGVASTKAYLAQLTAISLLGVYLVQSESGVAAHAEMAAALRELPTLIQRCLEHEPEIAALAEQLAGHSSFFYLGRGYDYAAALEAALKLKEISYLHAEAYPAGEMKHGPLALVEPGVAVVGFCTQPSTNEKMVSNLKEVKAREGTVVAVIREGDTVPDCADAVIAVPATLEALMPVVAMVPMQLLAYHVARVRGCEIDQPRNLAKSVTVE
ncbi:MAG TPA: glutamine--fructose-6-phosphate transaminase (isomerizing) [Chthonomonadaceae bacterium]|nr:glutamine--fructose-6-phosphate transaminase (isomerizing) [Chthonomonadaceae bacterium]